MADWLASKSLIDYNGLLDDKNIRYVFMTKNELNMPSLSSHKISFICFFCHKNMRFKCNKIHVHAYTKLSDELQRSNGQAIGKLFVYSGEDVYFIEFDGMFCVIFYCKIILVQIARVCITWFYD